MVNLAYGRMGAGRWSPPLLATLVACILAALPGRSAAQATTDEAINELRVRTPSGANDDRTIDDWLGAQIGRLGSASDPVAGKHEFLASLSRVRDAVDSKQEFKDAFAARLGTLAAAEFGKGDALGTRVADAIVRALLDAKDRRVVAGLTAALSFPAAEIRYLAARGCVGIRDSVPANERRPLLDALKQAGVREPNAVVVERIYTAMSYGDLTAEALDAIVDVLTARVAGYREAKVLADSAEASVLEYLAGAQIPRAQGVRIVRQLASMLRLDVEHYVRGGLSDDVGVAIELRVDVCERLLSRITGINPGETVRGVMQTGGPAVGPSMQLALIGWIGSDQADGALTAGTWNVPRGAD